MQKIFTFCMFSKKQLGDIFRAGGSQRDEMFPVGELSQQTDQREKSDLSSWAEHHQSRWIISCFNNNNFNNKNQLRTWHNYIAVHRRTKFSRNPWKYFTHLVTFCEDDISPLILGSLQGSAYQSENHRCPFVITFSSCSLVFTIFFSFPYSYFITSYDIGR